MNTIKKIISIIFVCIVVIIPQTGCGTTTEIVTDNYFCLDTVCTITIYDQDKETGEELISEAFELCREYENLLSKTVEGSDVYRINQAKGQTVQVSDDTAELIEKGIEFGEQSKGKFDITIGAVSELWDFHSDNPKVPDDVKIQQALKTVDYKKVQLQGNSVTLNNPEAKLDLGGIAKGYIADRVSEQLQDAGVEQAIINLGGNVVAMGEKEKGVPWTIGLERPYSDRSEIVGAVNASQETVTTSGVYERCFEEDGTLYHHVLDPDTGYPAKTELEAVTVKAPLGYSAESDVLGTIFLLLGEEESKALLEDYPDFQAAFIDGEDHISIGNGMEIQSVE